MSVYDPVCLDDEMLAAWRCLCADHALDFNDMDKRALFANGYVQGCAVGYRMAGGLGASGGVHNGGSFNEVLR